MSTSTTHIEFLAGLGYSFEEIAFLDLVTAHAGYFVANQFLEFTGRKKGRALREFTGKLAAHKYADFRTYRNGASVYHVSARKLYQAFGRESIGTRKRHSLEYIQTRLVALDFVLANPSCQFLKEEAHKIRFLSENFSVAKQDLPFRSYASPRNGKPTVRYFADHFPVFWTATSNSERPHVTFTFIDSGQPTVQPLLTHLSLYMPLFFRLNTFTFIYVAPSSRLFSQAETAFRKIVLGMDDGRRQDKILRYFRIRKAWESDERVLASDVLYLKDSRRRFTGSGIESLYNEWASDTLSDEQVGEIWRNTLSSSRVTFRTVIHGRSLSVFSGNTDEQLEVEQESSAANVA